MLPRSAAVAVMASMEADDIKDIGLTRRLILHIRILCVCQQDQELSFYCA